MSSLRYISALEISAGRSVYFGGDQKWYTDRRMQISGCGPTAAANIIWYFTQTRGELSDLCPIHTGEREEYRQLMLDMFAYVRPGMGGVNDPAMFATGLMHYIARSNHAAQSRILRIPSRIFGAPYPSFEKIAGFIFDGFNDDCPVAFLNYSNGKVWSLDSWHWVTIVAYHPNEQTITISDQGARKELSLYRWWKTTLLGGALVAVNITT